MTKTKILLFSILFCSLSHLHADLDRELKKFFDTFNSHATVNGPDAYQGQLAGHFTGGDASLRNKILDSKLAHISLPTVRAGCGGIDIFTGGFSFISKDELISALKSIGTNAVGYAFLLGLETVSPQIANNVKQLQSWANTINSIGINSCEAATQLVGAVWPRNTQAQEHICRTLGMQSGQFSDFISARHGCNQSTDRSFDPKKYGFDDLLAESFNVAWEVLQKQSILRGNPQLRKLFMSLTGTVVIKRDPQGRIQIQRYDSKVLDPEFIRTLLFGGETKGYACQGELKEGKCLEVFEEELTISTSEAWQAKIQKILEQIQDKIFSDEPLNEEEKDLINSTQFPLFKVINVMSAYGRGRSPLDLYQSASIVASDLLCQFIREVLQLSRESAQVIRSAQVNAEPIDEYIANLRQVERVVKELERKNRNIMEQETNLIQKMELIEDKLRSQLKL